MTTITIPFGPSNRASALAGMKSRISDRAGWFKVLSRRATELTKKQFRYLDKTRKNKLGGKRQHFWGDVSNATHSETSGDVIRVYNTHPVLAHKLGIGPAKGVIRPVRRKWLTMPAIKAAYGKSPTEYESGGAKEHHLNFWISPKDPQTAFLSEKLIAPKNGGPRCRIVYVLKKEIHQSPERDVLLNAGTYEAELHAASVQYLNGGTE